MKRSGHFDRTTKTVWQGEIDLKDAEFKIPPKVRSRLIWHGIVMASLPVTAFVLDQFAIFWFALGFALMLVGLETFICGFFGDVFSLPEADPVRFYGKGYLIFQACFWSILILGIMLLII